MGNGERNFGLTVEADAERRRAVMVISASFDELSDAEAQQLIFAMVEARKEWEAKGFSIGYRTRPRPRSTASG